MSSPDPRHTLDQCVDVLSRYLAGEIEIQEAQRTINRLLKDRNPDSGPRPRIRTKLAKSKSRKSRQVERVPVGPMSPAEAWIAQKAARRYRNVLMAGLPKGSLVQVVDRDGPHYERVE